MPIGAPDGDWLLADELLKRLGKKLELSMREMPLFTISVVKRTK
jgi:hypothetical protein